MSACVYVIEGAGLYKIGASSSSAKKRLVALMTGSPVPLNIVCEIPEPAYFALESALHRKFREKRSHREWFRLSVGDVEWIKSIATGLDWRLHLLSLPNPAKDEESVSALPLGDGPRVLLNFRQSAAILGVTRPGFVKMFERGDIQPEVTVGRQAFFSPEAVKALKKLRNAKKNGKKK